MQNIGLDGQESNCMELLALCTVLSMLLPTGLIAISALAQAVKHNQPAEMLQAGSKQSATKYLQCLQYQLCCLSAWSLLRTLAWDAQ
jgi:hypothetical protein